MNKVLVTGGYGYIGSHVVEALAKHGYAIDTLDRSISSNDITKYIGVSYLQDINNFSTKLEYDTVIHLAAAINVAESVANPSIYYKTNILGTLNVLENIVCNHVVFGSTGAASDPKSPYALSKIAGEEIVRELYEDHYTILRFYNVAGSNGMFYQRCKPSHLMRVTAMAACGKIPHLSIYGNNYSTRDGTCERDYIHVMDVADIIVKKVEYGPSKYKYENLGLGKGYTNLEVANLMKKVTGKEFKIMIESARGGDSSSLVADVLEENKGTRYIEDICMSSYEVECVAG